MKAGKSVKKIATTPEKPIKKQIPKGNVTKQAKKIQATATSKDALREKLEGKALQKLKETTFDKDGLREIKLPLHKHEWDFSTVPIDEHEFALFWEYRRDKIEFYDGLVIEEADGRHLPNFIGGNFACGIFWGLNWKLFPLPYLEVRDILEMELPNIKLTSLPDLPAISEEEINGLTRRLTNPESFNLNLIYQIGPKELWKKSKEGENFSIGGPLSIHCFLINWEKPKKEIWEGFRKWVQAMEMDRKKIRVNQGRLLQLGVARAKRAGMNSEQFGDRFKGANSRQKCGQKKNLYDDPSSFSKAAELAESELAKTRRPIPINGSVW
jgi:hypothetical protein